MRRPAYVSIRQHTSAYDSIRLVVVNVLLYTPMLTYENGYDPANGFGNPLVCSASVGVASSASSNIPAPASTNTHFAVRWDPRADAQALAFIRGIVLPVGYHSQEQPHHACDRQQSLEALP